MHRSRLPNSKWINPERLIRSADGPGGDRWRSRPVPADEVLAVVRWAPITHSSPRVTARPNCHTVRSRPRRSHPAFPVLSCPHRAVRRIHDFVRSVRDNVRRRQCDCFRRPLNDCRRSLSIDHCLKGLNRLLQLLVRKRLQGTRVLNPHLLGYEQCTNLHIRGRLIFPHPRNGLRAAFAEIPRQCLKKCMLKM
jgi:hypothetical protein